MKYFIQVILITTFMIFSSSAHSEDLKVVVALAKRVEWSDSIEALGTLRAKESVSLTASVTDTITKINFEDGQRVEKGFVLAEMTGDEESAMVAEMTARVKEAKQQLKRISSLPKTGAVSQSLLDQRKREYEAALAQLDATKSRLKDRLIVAPFEGVLGLRNISVGALVSPGDQIVTLTDDSEMKLDFSVPSVYLQFLKPGLEIVSRSSAFLEQNFKGQITSVDSEVNEATRSIKVRAIVPNHDRLLKPGLLMNVTLKFHPRNSIIIPEEALVPEAEGNAIFIVESSNTLRKQKIKIGSRKEGLVEVVSGISEGAQVVTYGTMLAKDGQKVQIIKNPLR